MTLKRFLPSFRRPKLQNKSCFFVHIPKTAGTSFRYALEQSGFTMFYDYGRGNPVNSQAINNDRYERFELFRLKRNFLETSNAALCGHVPVFRYMDFVDSNMVYSFVREPLSQLLSHYNHKVKYAHLDCLFEEFIEKKEFINSQSKMLSGLPIELYGHIGLTEQYDSSINIINELLGVDVATMYENINRHPKITNTELPKKITDRVKELNNKDYELYRRLSQQQEKKNEFIKEHGSLKAWVYSSVRLNASNVLVGCAFDVSGQPVELVAYVNDVAKEMFRADLFYSDYPKARFVRERYVGFRLSLENLLGKGDTLSIKVRTTGQLVYSNCDKGHA